VSFPGLRDDSKTRLTKTKASRLTKTKASEVAKHVSFSPFEVITPNMTYPGASLHYPPHTQPLTFSHSFVPFVSLSQEKVYSTHKMKFLFRLASTLLLAMTACGAPSTTKYSVKGLGVYGYAIMSDECSYTYVDVYASEQVTKSNGPPTPQTYAYASVFAYNYCDGFSYSNTYFEIANPNLKGSVTTDATLTAEAQQGYKCTFYPEYFCEEVQVVGSFNVVLTPTGSVYKGSSQSQYSSATTRTRVRSTGSNVDATLDFSGTVIDGMPFTPDYSYGSIYKYTSGSMDIIKV
jgi:hypothetical protein